MVVSMNVDPQAVGNGGPEGTSKKFLIGKYRSDG